MATSAPVQCEFALDDGKVYLYQVSPIDLRDLEQINQYARAKVIRAARLGLDDCKSEKERQDVLDAAMRVAGEISLLGTPKYFGSIEAAAFILHVSLVKQHKQNGQITFDQCLEIVRNDANQYEIEFAFSIIKGRPAERLKAGNDLQAEQNPILQGAGLGETTQQPASQTPQQQAAC